MNHAIAQHARLRWAVFAVALSSFMTGCGLDNFFDPSRTGNFEPMPTTIPVLARLDTIETEADLWGETTGVLPTDLMPGDLSYELAPGDLVTVQIFELYTLNQWTISTRRIDAGGFFRVPEIGDVPAAGMTPQEFEEEVIRRLEADVMEDPLVDIVVEEGGGLHYTIYGYVASPGLFTLRSPDLRLIEAIAIAGGISPVTQTVYVIREVPLSEDIKPSFDRLRPGQNGGDDRPGDTPDPVDIEELIEQLEDSPGAVSPSSFSSSSRSVDPMRGMDPPMPVALSYQDDDSGGSMNEQVDVDQLTPGGETAAGSPGHTFIYVEERGEWVRTRIPPGTVVETGVADDAEPELIVERIIEIPYQRLSHGDSSYNIIIRPGDRIYIDGPSTGVVYIDGEIARAGVYNLPSTGKLTLSRLVAAAGGLGPLAIPSRVDLTRVVGDAREATIRLDLGGIRQRNEPDVYLQPDDHIIIGTDFWATPLAVFRNGLRMTYGFGFVLDRNFSTDVFGPIDLDR